MSIDRAPALTAEEARTVARFDAAEVPPEVVAAGERQEAVARAIHQEQNRGARWELALGYVHREYRRLAAAAIAALPPSPAEEAVRRVEVLVDECWPDHDGLHPALRPHSFRARFHRAIRGESR